MVDVKMGCISCKTSARDNSGRCVLVINSTGKGKSNSGKHDIISLILPE